jgi:hypothetical protein
MPPGASADALGLRRSATLAERLKAALSQINIAKS